jgi:lipopolysaccharide transport system permease protein/teichoic acid transport system permease protein
MSVFGHAWRFTGALWKWRGSIWELARRDFVSQHSGTYLGVVWNFVQPLAYAGMLALVFSIGLRHNPGGEVKFIVYLLSGMIAWHFFAGALGSLTGIIRAHAFLVHKGQFNLAVLPVAKLLSLAAPHLALLAATAGIVWLNGIAPGWHAVQALYYLAAMACLLLGLGWIAASTSLFVEDVNNLVGIFVQFGFWFTPIVWNVRIIPPRYRWLVSLNPAAYLVNGYRDSLVFKVPFWQRPAETAYFWAFTLAVLVTGAAVFRRLRPHFGEVL